jgi:hypothetical protein
LHKPDEAIVGPSPDLLLADGDIGANAVQGGLRQHNRLGRRVAAAETVERA